MIIQNEKVRNWIAEAMDVPPTSIKGITDLKKGMTNDSFLFQYKNRKYIMRIPGVGTERLINRQREASVYEAIAGMDISDKIIYINPETGCKITEFWEGARTCDANNEDDLKACMKKMKEFHSMKLSVEHEVDIYQQIEFYESLRGGKVSAYQDYEITKKNVYFLKEYVASQRKDWCLTHIDAVPDNFLFTAQGDIRLIDWEYAGMQDPHVDIAMFCIYSCYDKCQVDRLIRIYFENECLDAVRIKIYCYIAAGGLLWSNWCEYKRSVGVEFGEYALRQYQFAKDYCRLAIEEMNKG